MTERAGQERNPVTHSTPPGRIASSESQLPSFDPGVPNPARMWNYWLGGRTISPPTVRRRSPVAQSKVHPAILPWWGR